MNFKDQFAELNPTWDATQYLDFLKGSETQQGEKHHILPRSLFPEHAKASWNLVMLSSLDHLRAHILLVSLHPKMGAALHIMLRVPHLGLSSEELETLAKAREAARGCFVQQDSKGVRFYGTRRKGFVSIFKGLGPCRHLGRYTRLPVDHPEYVHASKGYVLVRDKEGQRNKKISQVEFQKGDFESVYKGTLVAKEGDRRLRVSAADPRLKTGELQYLGEGKVFAVEESGQVIKVSKTDPRLGTELQLYAKGRVSVRNVATGETLLVPKGYDETVYEPVSKGQATMLDPQTGQWLKLGTDDPRRDSLQGAFKGRVMVQDSRGNKFRVSKDDPRWLSGELVSIHKGKVTVRDPQTGKHLRVSKDDPRLKTGELTYLGQKRG